MTLLCRLTLLLILMFWQGGFMFYGSVVVTVGAQVLGSEMEQGFVTRSVTNYLNCSAAVCLTIWGLVLWRDSISWYGWVLWLVLVTSLVGLAYLHLRMDQRLDVGSHVVAGKGFYSLHRAYLTISTVQWLASLFLLGVTLNRWMRVDLPD